MNVPVRVLIIDDDLEMVELLRGTCKKLGLDSDFAIGGITGLEKALSGQFPLIILDLSLPDLDGLELCREIRKKNQEIVILMVTSRMDEIDKVLGLELGADDYVTKPFGVRELMARIKALLRRFPGERSSEPQQATMLRFGELTINLVKHSVIFKDTAILLTAIEFEILSFLAANADQTLGRDELMNGIWGYNASRFDATITAHMSRLRAKMEADPAWPRFIHTVRGVGYRFSAPE